MIDLGNSGDVLFFDAFQKLKLDLNDMKMLCGSLTGLSGENVQIMGDITLETTYGKREDAKAIDTNYLIMEVITIQVIHIEDDDI